MNEQSTYTIDQINKMQEDLVEMLKLVINGRNGEVNNRLLMKRISSINKIIMQNEKTKILFRV